MLVHDVYKIQYRFFKNAINACALVADLKTTKMHEKSVKLPTSDYRVTETNFVTALIVRRLENLKIRYVAPKGGQGFLVSLERL